jgi:signal transduction histidine kinase
MTDSELDLVAAIDAVPHILEVACQVTGLGFAAVARVTEDRWTALAVRDTIGFGLEPGGELAVKTTICDAIRDCREPVVIDHVDDDPLFKDHPTPRMYGFQSYISVPIVLRSGEFFGTLCAIDPKPATVSDASTVKTFELFAELIAMHLENREKVAKTTSALLDERRTAEMREQFIAVLGHDLRNPLAAIQAGTTFLSGAHLDGPARNVVRLLQESAKRMIDLTTDILDFARGRLGGGVPLRAVDDGDLAAVLSHVIEELATVHPQRSIDVRIDVGQSVYCDSARLAQLLSNLLGNALTHGAPGEPVGVLVDNDGSTLTIEISNVGEAIPERRLDRLFQPFERGSDAPQDGLGLGLYIAAEIAKAHGGTLTASSTHQRTVFRAELPSRRVEAREEAEAAA